MSDEYADAWAATRILTVQEGMSWSGFERNHTFLNLGNGRFADVSRLSNADVDGDGRAVASVDWDDDGKLDLVLKNRTAPRVQIFHNRYPSSGSFLSVDLVGNGTTCNRDAINARVLVETQGARFQQTLHGGEGFLAQSSKRLHFGLGDATEIERVTVQWPDGTDTVLDGVEPNSRIVVDQSSEGHVVRAATKSGLLTSTAHAPPLAQSGPSSRVVLGAPLPMAPVRIPSFKNPERRVSDLAGAPVLLMLWSSDCTACMREFLALRQQGRRLDRLGLRVVTMNADHPTDAAAAIARLERYDLDTADAGFVDDRLDSVLWRTFYHHLFGPRTNLSPPSPTSLLLDSEGRLLVLYMGQVDLRTIEVDVKQILAEDERPLLDRLSGGYRLVHYPRDFTRLADACTARGHEELAAYYRELAEDAVPFLFLDGERQDLRR